MKKITLISLATFLVLLFSTAGVFGQQSKVKRRIPEKEINKNLKSKSEGKISSALSAVSGSIAVAENTEFNNYSVEQLVNNLLISGCLTTSNIRFGYYKKDGSSWDWNNHPWSSTPDNRQLGYFNQASSTFSIDEGIIFSTGKISSAEGSNDSGSKTDAMNSQASDPDLAAITGKRMYDAAVLEFDFVPKGNVIEFKFVFASEEYLEYVHTNFNDAFGFFLSGPGISGSYTNNAVNLAELPNGDAVTINNIHSAGTNIDGVNFPNHNEIYYVNNPSGSATMQYDGSTTVLTASYNVVPGSTYKIKMAIADASDQQWDAGVFLKARSFNTNTLVVNNPDPVCAPSTVDLTNSAITSGSSSGLTYTYWQDELATIPLADESQVGVGTYYIKGTDPVSGCSDIKPVIVTVSSVEVIESTAQHNDLICVGGDDGSFTVTATGGVAPYSFSLDNIDFTNNTGQFVGLSASTYTVYSKDANGCEDLTPLTVVLTEPDANICKIEVENCPPSDLVEVCSDGDGGTPVYWTPPQFSYNCCTIGDGINSSFSVEFDIPESQNSCWIYNNTQRIGSDNMRLWQSATAVDPALYHGAASDVFFVTPFQYFDNSVAIPINLQLLNASSAVNIGWTLQVLKANATATAYSLEKTYTDTKLLAAGTNPNPSETPWTITIPANDLPLGSGEYKLKFLFTGPGSNKLEVDYIHYNAILSDSDSCTEGINFVVTSTHNPGDEFPNGTTQVTYTATLTQPGGSLQSKTCVFDVVVNDPSAPTGNNVQNFCAIDFPTVADLVATGTSIKWYADASGGSSLNATDALSTGDYYATQTLGSCESTVRFKVDVTVNDTLPPTGESEQIFCSDDLPTIADLVVIGDNIHWYADATNRTPLELTDLLVNEENYYATQTIAGCESDTRFEVVVAISVVVGTEVTASHIDVTCNGGADGSFTITATGGTAPYSYSTDNTDYNNTTGIFSGLTAGTYTVYVKDANGCEDTDPITVTITEPAALTVSLDGTPSDVTCNGDSDGTISITVSGGTTDYTYSWTKDGSSYATTEDLTGLAAGTYQVTVTDVNGCTASLSSPVTITEPLDIILTTEYSNVTCNGASDGTITASATGGAVITVDGVAYDATATYGPGDYLVHAEAVGGNEGDVCFEEATITISEPALIIVNAGTTAELTCANATLVLNGSATSEDQEASFNYLWTTENGVIDSGATTLNPTISASGTYILTVTDEDTGCSVSDSVIITQDFTKPVVTLLASATELTCDLVSITLSASGTVQGTPSYLWSKDNNLIEGATSATLTVTEPGEYLVVIKDSDNGCLGVQKIVITQDITAPSVSVSAATTVLTCNTESITIAATPTVQGTASYLWSNGATTASIEVSTPGSYSVIVTDSDNGCSITSDGVTITQDITAPSVSVSAETTVITCNTESIVLTAAVEGTVTYLWSTGATAATIEITTPGDYSVTVTGANGCSATATVTVTGGASQPSVVISGNSVLTCVSASATLVATATVQGTASYLWSTGATTATIEVTAPGEYSVTVTDSSNDCSVMESVTVTQNTTPPAVTISGTSELTCNITSITLNASGSAVQGTASYYWNTGETTASIEVNEAGEYTVVVTDSGNGCSNAMTVTVTENYVATEITGDSIALCIEDASLNLTSLLPTGFVTGGTWNDVANSGGFTGNVFDPSLVNLGDYEFIYTEPGDCGRIITVTVNVNDDCVVLACSTEDMEISKVVTPNDDDFNDNFEITGLEGCGFTFGVKIFNRWGKIVYESNNYLNNWNGRHDGSGMQIGSNTKLPTGTYYYIVTVSGGSGFKPMSGYIYLGTH